MPPGPDGFRLLAALLAFGVLLVLLGPLAAFVAPLPIAIAVARGQLRFAGGLFAAVIAAGVFGKIGVLELGASGVFGFAIGWGIQRRLAYTRLVMSVTVLAVGLNGLSMMVAWDETVEEVNFVYEELGLRIENAQEEELNERALANLKASHWLMGHWGSIYLGMTFSGMLILACLMVSGAAKWLMLRDKAKAFEAFTTFRPPDWLAWVVIGAAVLWYVNFRSPVTALQFVSWNLGFAMVSVYWLNGLAVLMHAIAVLRPNTLVIAVIVAGLVFLGLASLLAIVGLFDTWGEFRARLDRFIVERKARDDSHDDMA